MSEQPYRQPGAASRCPPYSEEAEMGLLGSMLISPSGIDEFGDRISVEHFFLPQHQMIYSALQRMHDTQKPIELISVTQFMRDDGQLEAIGGASYLTHLFNFVPSGAAVGHYADIVTRKFIRRAIIARCTELVRQSYEEENIDEHVLLDQAQSEITSLAMESDRAEVLRHVQEGVHITLEKFEEAYRNRGKSAIHGLATGIIDFDRMTAGLRPQQFVIIGARPSQGKTALAMNLASNMAVNGNVPVAVFSMEMSYEEIVERLVCSSANVSLQALRLTGFMKESDFLDLPKRSEKVQRAPIWIDDSAGLTISAFKARARRAVVQMGVRAIIVDYLQLMKSPSRRAQDARWLEITEISAALKATAKELKVPVICCAQLNREAEGREFGKPKLSDLRESGSIEQDADIVALLWRPERHLENYGQREKLAKRLRLTWHNDEPLYGWDEPMTGDAKDERDRQINQYAELIVAKQRNGPVGEIKLRFESDITKFQNVTTKSWSNNEAERQK